ncbi:MAG: iron ABC transporter permease [Betaproteobacteria bacterium SG8_39]|nr:MAG: iron ABC transporter permease [Betaproteobacteria bacterium SG8_39]
MGTLPLRATRTRLGALGWSAVAAAVLLAFPLLAVVANVLQGGGGSFVHLATTVLPRYVGNTALLLAGVSWGVISIGVLSAWLVTAYQFPGRRVLPAYVMAYAYTDWLQFTGPVQSVLRELFGCRAREYWFPEVRSLWGAAAMLSFALYPYVYLIARTAFLDLSRHAVEAGRLAGLTAWKSFFHVAVPLARPAIAAGTALALMETLADFGTVSYFAVDVFTTGIFKAWLSMGDSVAAAQLSSCLLAFVIVVLALERASRGRAAYHGGAPRKRMPPQPLRGAAGVLALAACAAPVVFGFLLPVGILLDLALRDPDLRWGSRLFMLIGNSTSIAAITAGVAVALAATMAYAGRLARAPLVAFANRVASLGYAIPGAVIAVGVLVPLGRLDNWLADLIEQAFGVRVGLLLTGTVVALVYAYLVRFLAIALQTVEAGLTKLRPSMDDAARSLGASPGATLLRVHAPLLASSFSAAALLVFVDVMKELPATFALRPFNFDTLAVEAYHLAKDERLAEAALPSLVIVAVGLLPLLLVSRRLMRPGSA